MYPYGPYVPCFWNIYQHLPPFDDPDISTYSMELLGNGICFSFELRKLGTSRNLNRYSSTMIGAISINLTMWAPKRYNSWFIAQSFTLVKTYNYHNP